MKKIAALIVIMSSIILIGCNEPTRVSGELFQKEYAMRNTQTMHHVEYLGERDGKVYLIKRNMSASDKDRWEGEVLYAAVNELEPSFRAALLKQGLRYEGAKNERKTIERELPAAFHPIKWNMDEAAIREAFKGKKIETYKQRMTVGLPGNRFLKGTVRTTSVDDHDLPGIFSANIYFHTIKKHAWITIESTGRWENCDIPQVDKKKCEQEYRKLNELYKKIIQKINSDLGEKGTYVDDPDPENEGDKHCAWDVNGFHIAFMLLVDDMVSFLQFHIRKQSRNAH